MNDIKQTIPSCFRSECNSIINETIDNMKSNGKFYLQKDPLEISETLIRMVRNLAEVFGIHLSDSNAENLLKEFIEKNRDEVMIESALENIKLITLAFDFKSVISSRISMVRLMSWMLAEEFYQISLKKYSDIERNQKENI